MDAEQIFAAPEMMELKLRQVAFADMLILNKVDLVTRHEIERIKAWLDDRFHRYRLVEASGGNVPLEILVSVGRFDPPNSMAHRHRTSPLILRTVRIPIAGITCMAMARSLAGLQDVELRNAAPLSLEALRETARQLPASVYRCKGVVHTAEEPGRRVILQVVGKRVDLAVGEAWHGREPRTRILAIGAHDGVDGGALREVFDRCRDVECPRIASTDLDV